MKTPKERKKKETQNSFHIVFTYLTCGNKVIDEWSCCLLIWCSFVFSWAFPYLLFYVNYGQYLFAHIWISKNVKYIMSKGRQWRCVWLYEIGGKERIQRWKKNLKIQWQVPGLQKGKHFSLSLPYFRILQSLLFLLDRNYDCFYFVCLVNLINNLNIFLNYIYIYITFKMIKQGFLSVLSESLSMVLF